MKSINDQAYKEGQAAFAKGKTLHHMVGSHNAACQALEDAEKDGPMDYKKMQQLELDFLSAMLGFADGLLAKLRSR